MTILFRLFKVTLKEITPPIIWRLLVSMRNMCSKQDNVISSIEPKKMKEGWSGDFKSWEEAIFMCSGYEADNILEKCKIALLKVKNGEAIYERDSVLFNEIEYSWGMLAGLQRVAIEHNGSLCVLDFGGSLGSSYFQNKQFLSGLNKLEWCIIEQKHFVDCGKQNFENNYLKFYNTIDECLVKHKPNIILLSSVLQYLENPYEWLDKFIKLDVSYIILDRTSFIDHENDILTIQNVPESIYKANYPAWFFGNKMTSYLINKYEVVAKFDNGFTSSAIISNNLLAHWQGIILKKK